MSEDSSQAIDLEPYLSVLDREQLEHLVVRMIMKDPENFLLVEKAAEHLDQNQLLISLDPIEDTNSIDDIFPAISAIFTRYQTYMKLGLHFNALTVLYALSNQILLKLFEFGFNDDTTAAIDLITKLEIEWKSLALVYTPDPQKAPKKPATQESAVPSKNKEKSKKGRASGTTANESDEESELDDSIFENIIDVPYTLMDIFEKLAQWRIKLEKLGPMFSDPLRTLKSRIKKQNDNNSGDRPTKAESTLDQKRTHSKSSSDSDVNHKQKKQRK